MIHRLDKAIPPEIADCDEFYCNIRFIAAKPEVVNILEIGSSDGRGSTKAFIEGMVQNPNKCNLFCLESSQGRFQLLRDRYKNIPQVQCYNYCSVPLGQYMSMDDIREFHRNTKTNLNQYPIAEVLGWYQEELNYIQDNNIPDNGIEQIKKDHGIDIFDAVLIDGSAFTGEAEVQKIYGAKYIMLDDIFDIKNYNNWQMLEKHQNYTRIKFNKCYRNGYVIFRLNN